MENDIRYAGIVEKVDGDTVSVRIEQQSACSACHARRACLASDKKDKMIEVCDESRNYAVNEAVVVSARSAVGWLAVVIAFVLPLLLTIAVTTLSLYANGNEGISALIGLSALIPYYLIVYLFRNRLKKKMVFTLSKAPSHPLYQEHNI